MQINVPFSFLLFHFIVGRFHIAIQQKSFLLGDSAHLLPRYAQAFEQDTSRRHLINLEPASMLTTRNFVTGIFPTPHTVPRKSDPCKVGWWGTGGIPAGNSLPYIHTRFPLHFLLKIFIRIDSFSLF